MTRFARVLLPLTPLLLAACGGTEPAPDTVDENVLYFETGQFEVPPGDSFECFYTDTFTDKELAVYGSDGQQGPGGHHIVVYWTDIPREPTHHPCKDEEMVSWHQIAGSGGEAATATDTLALPEGLANRVPAGKQLVIQAHYINVTGEMQTVNDWVKLKLMDPARVQAYVNYMAAVDETFEIPAHSKHTSTTTCTVERDFDIVLSLSHMHEYGTRYTLEEIDEQGAVLSTLRDDAWSPVYTSHPPIDRWTKDQPFSLKKGTRLRQTCTWDNTTAESLLFPREMCLGFFYYYPDEGEFYCNMVAQ
jgi:hypothetical protein